MGILDHLKLDGVSTHLKYAAGLPAGFFTRSSRHFSCSAMHVRACMCIQPPSQSVPPRIVAKSSHDSEVFCKGLAGSSHVKSRRQNCGGRHEEVCSSLHSLRLVREQYTAKCVHHASGVRDYVTDATISRVDVQRPTWLTAQLRSHVGALAAETTVPVRTYGCTNASIYLPYAAKMPRCQGERQHGESCYQMLEFC